MRSNFEQQHRRIVVYVAKGLTFEGACRRCEVPVNTARGWLKRGRAEPGPHRRFAEAISEARAATGRSGLVSEEELFELVVASARGGSVSAMRLLRGMLKEGHHRGADQLAKLDELAARRAGRKPEARERDRADARGPSRAMQRRRVTSTTPG